VTSSERQEDAPEDPHSDLDLAESDERGSRRRLRALARPAGATVTVIVAIWGALTGTVAWLQSRQISVDLAAETYLGYYRTEPAGAVFPDEIRLSLVNTSSRAVSLLSGAVLVDDRVVGKVLAAGLDQAINAPPPTRLPYSFAADSSSRVRLNWAIDTGSPQRELAAIVNRPIGRRQIAVRLRFEPGGDKRVTVRTGQQAVDPAGWKMLLAVERNRITRFQLFPGTRDLQPALGVFELWSKRGTTSKPTLKIKQPTGWGTPAQFELPRSLPSGQYVFTASAGETVVAIGTLQSDCVAKDGWYVVNACATGNARAFKMYLPLTRPQPSPTTTK
jgi:hypothetical protein